MWPKSAKVSLTHCVEMGIINRRKSTIVTGTNVKCDPPIQQVVVRNADSKNQKKKDTTAVTHQPLEGVSKVGHQEIKDVAKVKNPHERQRMHVDRLYDISHRHVEESLRRDNKDSSTEFKYKKGAEHFALNKQKQCSISATSSSATTTRMDQIEDSLGACTVNTTRGSCSVVELLSSLYVCGWNENIDDEDSNTKTTSTDTRKEQIEKPKPEVLVASRLTSIPREISFTDRNDTAETTKHVLLREVDDFESLDSSILSCLRRTRGRTTSLPKIRVYVEPAQGMNRIRSVEFSVLTGPDK